MFNATNRRTIVGNSLHAPDTDSDGLTTLEETYQWVDSTDSVPWDYTQRSDPGRWGNDFWLNIPPYKPTGLDGERENGYAKLKWNPNEEFDLKEYDIFKKTYDDSTQTYSSWHTLATTSDTFYVDSSFLPSYQWSDTAFYKITAVDSADQSSEYSDVYSAPGEIRPFGDVIASIFLNIKEFVLGDNYPNPFNPTTTISFTIANDGFVTLKVYDIMGCEVASLLEGYRLQGDHRVTFDAGDLPSGVYIYRLESADHVVTKKMVLTK
jgi:hypothetical protein